LLCLISSWAAGKKKKRSALATQREIGLLSRGHREGEAVVLLHRVMRRKENTTQEVKISDLREWRGMGTKGREELWQDSSLPDHEMERKRGGGGESIGETVALPRIKKKKRRESLPLQSRTRTRGGGSPGLNAEP